jgi:DNA-binding GntR family transcriptional regulator
MVEPTPLHRASLHEEVAARLRTMVFERQLAAGAGIDELALAREWHISRTPMREALKVLAAEGLVTLVPRQGCRVTELSEDDADELFPIMALLEGRCAFEAASKAKPADLKQLRRLHDALEKHAAARNVDGYYRANHAVPQQGAGARREPLARPRDQRPAPLRAPVARTQLNWPGRIEQSIGEHRALLAAIEDKEPARAEKLMHDHLMAQLAALKAMRAHERAGRQHAMLDTLREAAKRVVDDHTLRTC